MKDNPDRMVALLETIAQNTGGLGDLGDAGTDQEVNIQGSTPDSRIGMLAPQNLVVSETDDLDAANDDGSVTLEPGDSVTVVEIATDQPTALLAVGASDAEDVEYQLVVDDQYPIGRATNSPLGTVNDPFSFVDVLGGAVPAQRSVSYQASLAPEAGSSVDLVGRMYGEVV